MTSPKNLKMQLDRAMRYGYAAKTLKVLTFISQNESKEIYHGSTRCSKLGKETATRKTVDFLVKSEFFCSNCFRNVRFKKLYAGEFFYHIEHILKTLVLGKKYESPKKLELESFNVFMALFPKDSSALPLPQSFNTDAPPSLLEYYNLLEERRKEWKASYKSYWQANNYLQLRRAAANVLAPAFPSELSQFSGMRAAKAEWDKIPEALVSDKKYALSITGHASQNYMTENLRGVATLACPSYEGEATFIQVPFVVAKAMEKGSSWGVTTAFMPREMTPSEFEILTTLLHDKYGDVKISELIRLAMNV